MVEAPRPPPPPPPPPLWSTNQLKATVPCSQVDVSTLCTQYVYTYVLGGLCNRASLGLLIAALKLRAHGKRRIEEVEFYIKLNV